MADEDEAGTEHKQSDFRLLKLLRLIAVSDGAFVFAISYFLMTGFSGVELVPLMLSLTFAGFVYGAAFYFAGGFEPDQAGSP